MRILLAGLVPSILFSLVQSRTLENQQCTDGAICVKQGLSGVCYGETCFVASPSKKLVLVKVQYQSNNSHVLSTKLDASSMWLRGNGLGLTWNKGKQMKRSSQPDTWELLLEFTIPVSSSDTNEIPRGRFEFRVYLHDTKDMLGSNFATPLPLSTNTNNASDIPVVWAYPWFFTERGTTKQRTIFSPELQQNRTITVYMPASFTENKYKKYETLFVNDGQRLKYMIPQIDSLVVTKARLKEVVIIGVDNDFIERTQLLAPTNGTDVVCKQGNDSNRCNNCLKCTSESRCTYQQLIQDYNCYYWKPVPEVRGQRYLDFIENTLIPETKNNYRAMPGASNFGIMGFSFGGLVACHAMWTRSHAFGSAACMSPSLWWPFPENGTFPDDAVNEFVTVTLKKHRNARPRQKVYIDIGSEEGDVMLNPTRDTVQILLNTSYFEINKNLWYYVWSDQAHNFKRVLDRMWLPMLALYGAEGSSQHPDPNTMTSGYINEKHHVLMLLSILIALRQVY